MIGDTEILLQRVMPLAKILEGPSRQAYKLDRLNIMGYYKNRRHLTSHRQMMAVLVRAGLQNHPFAGVRCKTQTSKN